MGRKSKQYTSDKLDEWVIKDKECGGCDKGFLLEERSQEEHHVKGIRTVRCVNCGWVSLDLLPPIPRSASKYPYL